VKEDIEGCMSEVPCPECRGKRLKKEVLAVTVGGMNIADFTELSVGDALKFMETLRLSPKDALIAEQILKEIKTRLGFLQSVGLEYLTLSRSGGDAVRRREPSAYGWPRR
jgi:excinuclease ABC subunit A